MKNRRKQPVCLNCQTPLRTEDNYCPNCGQENTTFHLSAKGLLNDFVQSYFNFDSRLGRSLVPFLFQPGKLTREFVEGKRLKYVHPVRFYLIVSLVFFFIFSQLGSPEDVNFVSMDNSIDSLSQIPESDQALLKSVGVDLDSAKFQQERQKLKANTEKGSVFGNEMVFNEEALLRWLKDENTTPSSLLDSLQASRKSAFDLHLAAQVLRAYQDKGKSVNQQIIESIPTMLFLFLPLLAGVFKLLYIRKNILYIEHLILTFHYHTFIFFALGVAMLFDALTDWGEVYWVALLSMAVYGFVMTLNFYRQAVWKTAIKFIVLVTAYFMLLTLFLLLEILLSFLIF